MRLEVPSPALALRHGLALVALAVLPAGAQAPGRTISAGGEHPVEYTVFFELRAETRSRRLDADLEATARLLMSSTGAEDGSRSLSLVRPLQPATKLYRVDPSGPFGSEAKMAAVVTLDEGSWEALERARREVDMLGRAAHEGWQRRTGLTQPFGGAFAFVVIGPARGRFRIGLDAEGLVVDVANELTDHWLAGPFDQFVGGWSSSERAASAPTGYWFWNRGETEPFDYEPHVYHALEQALGLLRHSLPRGDTPEVWPDVSNELLGVLTTLAPKTARNLQPDLLPVTAALVAPGVVEGRGGAVRLTARRSEASSTLEATWQGDGLLLDLRVGYERVASVP